MGGLLDFRFLFLKFITNIPYGLNSRAFPATFLQFFSKVFHMELTVRTDPLTTSLHIFLMRPFRSNTFQGFLPKEVVNQTL